MTTTHVGGSPVVHINRRERPAVQIQVREVPVHVYKPYVPRWLAYTLAGETVAVLTLLVFGSPL